MKTYRIEILEKLSRTVEVNAESADEAIQEVADLYKDEEIILDSSDYDTTDINISEQDEEFSKLLEDRNFSSFLLANAEKIISHLSKEELAKFAFGSLLTAKEEYEKYLNS